MGKKERNIIYLSEKKNIFCLQGVYLDLNLICRVEDGGDVLYLHCINGDTFTFNSPGAYKSYKNVPKKYLKHYKKESEVEGILKGLSPEFSYFNDYNYDYYRIYNKLETEKEVKFVKIHWDLLKNEVINRWLGVSDVDTSDIKVVNHKVIRLMNKYYELNKDEPIVLDNIKKVFGFKLKNILDTLKIEGDYYVDKEGNIIRI